MNLLILGAGAAEGVPAAYCRCESCQGVRERGGVELKSRSSLRIDDRYQIDINPDSYLQMNRAKTDMYEVRHLLISHSHEDHLSLSAIYDKTMSQEVNGDVLEIYMSEPAYDFVQKLINLRPIPEPHASRIKEMFELIPLRYFSSYRIGECTVETVAGAHNAHGVDERSINYLVTDAAGKSLLYAVDTGYYLDDTWEYLEGKRVDALIMDCTFAGRTDRGERPHGHLDLRSFLEMLERMHSIGFTDSTTTICATHFNPHQGLSHFEIQERFDASQFRVTAAYDGLSVNL